MIRCRAISSFCCLLGTLILGLGSFRPARAGEVYVDAGVGVSTLWFANSAFNQPTMSPMLNLSFGASLAALINLAADNDPLQFHLGVIGRYSNGFDPTTLTTYSFITPYPTVRIDFFGRFYVGFGATVFTWKRASGTFGFDGLTMASTIAGMVQAGLEWWVTPFFALCLEGTAEAMSFAGAPSLSPFPNIEGLLVMRFPLGLAAGGGSGPGGRGGGTRPRYDGWRYPFGFGK